MSVTAPSGFVAAGTTAGVKASGALDLALVAPFEGAPVPAAAVFTLNQAAAAPVQVSRQHLQRSRGLVGAVVLNSGCANAATGAGGLAAARATAASAGASLGLAAANVLICSTGVIGTELPLGNIERAIPGLVAARADSFEAARQAAVAIMTTDTRPKQAIAKGTGFVVGGMGKGAAMLAPNMATMLAVLTTDADASATELDRALRSAVDASFNQLSIDGCTSTNDSVIVLASGRGAHPSATQLTAALTEACQDLAYQMASDAEGGTKVVRVVVAGAADGEEARRCARAIADSNLVKCSWYGADPNWGRVVSEAGAAGVAFELDQISVSYGGIEVCAAGEQVAHDEQAVAEHLAGGEIVLVCNLGLGEGRAEILSADLTHGYVDENMGRS